jgi:hypothetical protein
VDETSKQLIAEADVRKVGNSAKAIEKELRAGVTS